MPRIKKILMWEVLLAIALKARIFLLDDLREFFSDLGSGDEKK